MTTTSRMDVSDAWGQADPRAIQVGRCALGLAESCRFRALCEGEAQRLARARAGSRPDFDEWCDRYLPKIEALVRGRIADARLADALTRELAIAAVLEREPEPGCAGCLLGRLTSRIAGVSERMRQVQ